MLLLPQNSDDDMNFGAGRSNVPNRVLSNMTVYMYCPVSGIDLPKTRWVRVDSNGDKTDVVEMPPTITIVKGSYNLTLVIRNFNKEMEGTYRCITTNNAGDDEGDVVLRCKQTNIAQ